MRPEFLQRFYGVRVLRVQLDGTLIIPDSEFLITVHHVGFAQAVIHICGLRIGFDIELKDFNRLPDLLHTKQPVA